MNVPSSWKTAVLLAHLCSISVFAQTAQPLPDAPSTAVQTPSTNPPPVAETTAQVHGFVQDLRGRPLPNAQVTLSAPGKLGDRTILSAANGAYRFKGVVPGDYRLIVSAPGLNTYTSGEFTLKPGQDFAVPETALTFSTTTSVNVVASPEQVAVAQVHEEEKQRVLGIFPNFYTSYIWDAQPMPASQKFALAGRSLIDPVQFVIVGATAGAEQFENIYPAYGSGIEGYGKRFGAALADSATSRIVGSALLPSLLHQDPRYFYQGSGGVRSRSAHAIASVFLTRGDNGRNQPNYSHLLGSLTAGAVANAYHPASSRGLGLTFQTFAITLAGNAAGNLFREFLLRKLESIPLFANGKH